MGQQIDISAMKFSRYIISPLLYILSHTPQLLSKNCVLRHKIAHIGINQDVLNFRVNTGIIPGRKYTSDLPPLDGELDLGFFFVASGYIV